MKIDIKIYLCIGLPVILLVFSGSWISGCGTGTDERECPDTSFSQTNLDTLVAKQPDFIWRICNANEEYTMENLVIDNNWTIKVLAPCKCSKYFSSIPNNSDVEWPVEQVIYDVNGEEYFHIYLSSKIAERGLKDSTFIYETPGRYTYYINRDTTKHFTEWIEIEREAYHEN